MKTNIPGSDRARELLFLLALMVFFIAFKYDHMHLPYFWDEAWSYVPAIKAMQETGPSLLPNSIAPELYKGHPLLFYFLSSLWLRVLGDSIFVSKLFPMTVSLCLILAIYFLFKKLFGLRIAIASTLFFSIQSVFIVQSSFLLPEVLLTLLTVLSFYAFFTKNKLWICIWLSLALLTKESGSVLWVTLFLVSALDYFRKKERKSLLQEFWFLGAPIVLFAGFFIFQKFQVGWYFYPEHISYLSFQAFTGTFRNSFKYLFLDMGRIILASGGILSVVYLLSAGKIKWHEELSHILVFCLFISIYLFFTSINFYTPRYILSVLPFTSTIFVFFTIKALERKRLIAHALLATAFIYNFYFTFTKRGGDDNTLGFKDAIICHQEVVRYCEQQDFYNKNIVAHFLMEQDLKNMDLGYLKYNPFPHVSTWQYDSMEIAIISSIEYNSNFMEEIRKREGKLIKRFEKGKEWSEVYEIGVESPEF